MPPAVAGLLPTVVPLVPGPLPAVAPEGFGPLAGLLAAVSPLADELEPARPTKHVKAECG